MPDPVYLHLNKDRKKLHSRSSFGRTDAITMGLLKGLVSIIEMEKWVETEDFARIPSLQDLFDTVDRVINEMGFGDDETTQD